MFGTDMSTNNDSGTQEAVRYSECSTVPADADGEQGFFSAGKATSSGSAMPEDQPRRNIMFLLVFPALGIGAVVGILGTVMCNMFAPDFAQALGISTGDYEGPASHSSKLMLAGSVFDISRRKYHKVLDRDFIVYTPMRAKFAQQRLPAVIVLHGTRGFAAGIATATRFEERAELANQTFLAVFPEMERKYGYDWGYEKDLDYFKALVSFLERDLWVNRREIYICGHSAGGTMALFLQNNLPDLFRGAAAVEAGAGTSDAWRKSFDQKMLGRPTMLVWNNNDPVLKKFHLKPADTIRTLRRHDDPGAGPSFVAEVPVLDHSWVRYAKRFTWGAVGATPPTVFISWETYAPTHMWSNSRNIPGSFDATALIWDFFRSIDDYGESNRLDNVQF